MCQSNVYLLNEGREELVMEDVSVIRPVDGELLLEGILGEQKKIKARFKELQLVDHKIILEK